MFNKVLSNGNDNSNGNTNSPQEAEARETAQSGADPVHHSIKNITAGFYHHHLNSSAFMTPEFAPNSHFRPYENNYTGSFDHYYQNGSNFKNFSHQQNFQTHQSKNICEPAQNFATSQINGSLNGPPSSASTGSNSISSSASPALNESPNPAPAVVAALYHSAVNAVSDPIQASKIAAAAAAASSYSYNNSHIHHPMFGLSLPTYSNQSSSVDYSTRFYQSDFLSDYEKTNLAANGMLQNSTGQNSSSSSNASSSSIKSNHLGSKMINSSSSLNGSQSDSRVNRCRICDKTYARPSTLKTHMRTHSGEKPYKCDKCSKAFTQAANLTAHLRTHSGEKPFSCEICGRKFSQSSSVTTHMRTHSGERPYACKFCRKAFSDSSTLTKHMRVHSGEKPYQCQLCQLRFSQSGNLNRHMRIHQNQQQQQQPNVNASNGYSSHMASSLMRNSENTIEEEDENEESLCSETESQTRIRPDMNEEDRFNDYYQRNLRQHQQFQQQHLLYQQQPLLHQPQLSTDDVILHPHSTMQPFSSHNLQQQHLQSQFSHSGTNGFGQNFAFNQHQSGLGLGHHLHHQPYLPSSTESADVVAHHAQQLQLQHQLMNIRKMECVDYNNN